MTVVFALVCTVPYAIAWTRAAPSEQFSGILLNGFDQSYYLSAQRSAAEDTPRRNRFTAEPDAPGPVSSLYPLLGEFQGVTGLPTVAVYHMPRVLAVAILPALLAWFFGLCFPKRREVVMGSVLLTLFTTGVLTIAPWLPAAERSSEWIPESNVLRSSTVFPHFSVAYVGLVLGYGAIALAIRGRRPAVVVAVALLGGALIGITHPFLLLAVAIVLGTLGLAALLQEAWARTGFPRTVRLVAAGAVLVPGAPLTLMLRHEQGRLEEANRALFPSSLTDTWWTWTYAYGIVSVLVVAGLARLVSDGKKDEGTRLLFTIGVVHVVLMYSSATPFQRRYSEGLIVALAGVAGLGLWWIAGDDVRRRAAASAAVFAVLLLGTLVTIRNLGQSGVYLPSEYAALWKIVTADDVVLAGHEVSHRLPAFSPGTAYVARPVETLHYRDKRLRRSAYAERPEAPEALRWLDKEGITMVVVDDRDRTFLAQVTGSTREACLQGVFQNRHVRAYRVSPSCPQAARGVERARVSGPSRSSNAPEP